jgi:Arylsulfatase A and related enzymes
MSVNEYKAGTAFPGTISRTIWDSAPAWPAPVRARAGAPNVLFIVLDDTGFAQIGCYGAPIRTPNIDRLAKNGLLYANMHTAALCSPTRSCILTGRNHHSNGISCMIEGPSGFPGSNGNIPFENGFLGEMLLQHGYNTYAIGKWHLTPVDQISAAGPYDRWPLGRGFERYYGFLAGDTSQYYPDLVYDNRQAVPPTTPEHGYHLTEDLTNKAIQFITDAKQVDPAKPFFLYFATGAHHAPHQVPQAWADRYIGKFDDGWDAYRNKVFARQKEIGLFPENTALSEHDPDVADWNSLSADERRLYSRMMEVFAGFVEHTDHYIGRLIDFLAELGELDNTLIMLISDNGTSPGGGPSGSVNENRFFNNVPDDLATNLEALGELGGARLFNHYSWGWAFAGNTPFRRWKRETYRGGISGPFIVHWPRGIKSGGEIRHQFAHVIDMVPTVLDLLDLEPPAEIRGVAQSPIQGVSFAHTLDDPTAPSKHLTQYFETFAHRSIYHAGWRAVCPFPGPSYEGAHAGFGDAVLTEDKLRYLDSTGWELYNVEVDPAETRNLAVQDRATLIEMIALWYAEAGTNQVFPLDSRGMTRLLSDRPKVFGERLSYTYYPNTQSVPEHAAVSVLNQPHTITASLEIPAAGAEGVIVGHGSAVGGYVLFIKDRRLHYVQNYVGIRELRVQSGDEIREGPVTVRFTFTPTGEPDFTKGRGSPGRARLFIDDHPAGDAEFPVTVPITMGLGSALTVGRNPGSSISVMYDAPFAFTGTIKFVRIDRLVKHEASSSEQREAAHARAGMTRR